MSLSDKKIRELKRLLPKDAVNKKSVLLIYLRTALNRIKWNLRGIHGINVTNIKKGLAIKLFAEFNGLLIPPNTNYDEWLIRLYIAGEHNVFARNKKMFYSHPAWIRLRKQVLDHYGCRCMKCGYEDASNCVDHIKPRSKFPELELDFNNMQVLCSMCNLIKSNRNYIDYRP